MRKIAFVISILVMALLLNACRPTEEKLENFYKSRISFGLEHPQQVTSAEEFSIKVYAANNLTFPVTLSSMAFSFSDFYFVDEKGEKLFAVNPNSVILPNSSNTFEYKAKKNMEADLGSGVITSLMQFDLQINDPKYGAKDLRMTEDFVLESARGR